MLRDEEADVPQTQSATLESTAFDVVSEWGRGKIAGVWQGLVGVNLDCPQDYWAKAGGEVNRKQQRHQNKLWESSKGGLKREREEAMMVDTVGTSKAIWLMTLAMFSS